MKTLLDAYKTMLSIRLAEEEIAAYYLANKVMSFVHFYVGQEAVATGVCHALEKEDRVMGNHRSHGHYLAKGGDLKRMMCELLGKEEGCCHGKGGSMHMIDKSVNFIGSTPILGSVVPIAHGSAFEQKYSGSKNITVAFCGDGAFEEGVVLETLNLSGLFKTPFLLVVENNLYAVNSKINERRAEGYDIEKVVTGSGITYSRADGNDYEDVYAKASVLIQSIKNGGGPAVLECVTYRHMAHSAPIFDDVQGYRVEDVLDVRLEKDCIKKIKRSLLEQGIQEGELLRIADDIKQYTTQSMEYAVRAPYPAKESLYTQIYA